MLEFVTNSEATDDRAVDRREKAPFSHLALVGNALPRRCGLATYTSHVAEALMRRYPSMQVDHYAMDDGSGVEYPADINIIAAEDKAAYRAAAERIEALDADFDA